MSTNQAHPRLPGVHFVVERMRYPEEPQPLNRRIYSWARAPFVALFWVLRFAAWAGGLALLGAALISGGLLVLGVLLSDSPVTWSMILRALPRVWERTLDIAPWLLIGTVPGVWKSL